MLELPADLAATASVAGLAISKVLHRTSKTLLAAGTLGQQRVAVKILLGHDPFWAAKWHHELCVYQAFAGNPPPLRVPRLLYTDNSRMLVLEWLDGQRLDDDRYPRRAITTAETETVLNCVRTLNMWPAPASFGAVLDYPDRFRRYHDKGYLTGADHDALQRLLAHAGQPSQLNHGDPLPSNILIDTTQGAALLDWEFTGLFLPGFDLAMLHTQLGANTPGIRERIDAAVAEDASEAPFAINLAAVVARELRIHHELPAGPLRDARLPLIEAAWAQARDRLHRQAARQP